MNPWFTTAWLIWIGTFIVIEMVAIFNSTKGDTFSEHVWAFLGIKHKGQTIGSRVRPAWTMFVARILFFGITGWALLHLAGVPI